MFTVFVPANVFTDSSGAVEVHEHAGPEHVLGSLHFIISHTEAQTHPEIGKGMLEECTKLNT